MANRWKLTLPDPLTLNLIEGPLRTRRGYGRGRAGESGWRLAAWGTVGGYLQILIALGQSPDILGETRAQSKISNLKTHVKIFPASPCLYAHPARCQGLKARPRVISSRSMRQSGTQGLPAEPKGRSARGFKTSPLSLLPVGPLTEPPVFLKGRSLTPPRKPCC